MRGAEPDSSTPRADLPRKQPFLSPKPLNIGIYEIQVELRLRDGGRGIFPAGAGNHIGECSINLDDSGSSGRNRGRASGLSPEHNAFAAEHSQRCACAAERWNHDRPAAPG
jgi:hypothetical protein